MSCYVMAVMRPLDQLMDFQTSHNQPGNLLIISNGKINHTELMKIT